MGGGWRFVRQWIGAVIASASVLLVGVTIAAAQDPETATIEIVLTQSAETHDLILYRSSDEGDGRREVTRVTGFTGDRWTIEVEPGCYAVRIERTTGIPGAWLDPISRQPAFCLGAGETASHVTGALTRQSAGRPIVNGEVVDPDGNGVPGVVVDFFDPPAGASFDEVRLLDHDAADHRGAFQFSRTTGDDGWWRFSDFRSRCFVQTFTAPDGYTWAGGRRYVNRSACSSEYAVLTAYPEGTAPPADGFLLIDVPAEVAASGLQVTVDHADTADPRPRSHWSRTGIPLANRIPVPAGCHVVSFDIGDTRTVWTGANSSIQDVPVCVTSGGEVRVRPAVATRIVDYDLDLPFLIGLFSEIVDDRPRGVPGAKIDLFYPIDGISDEELRGVDHTQRDYRGAFYRSATVGPDGEYVLPVFARCFVATLVAPDGYEFEANGGRYLQQTHCQEADGRFQVLRRAGQEEADFSGRIVTESGDPVEGVAVDVFTPIDGVTDEELPTVDHVATDYRGRYRQTAVTGADGAFSFRAESRCWVVTYIGTETVRFPTGRYYRQTLCPGDSPTIVVPDTDRQPSTITGSVVGGPEITVDLFAANADGTRGTWLGDTSTVGGSYGFDVAPGCYVTVLIAPDGFVFAATGSRWQQMPACVEADEVLTNPDGQLRRS